MKQIFLFLIFSLLVFSACSYNNDKKLFESADQKIKAKNYSEALKDYEKIVEDYPDSENAAASLFTAAGIYQGYQLTTISKEESMKKALGCYQKLFDDYPKDERAPKSLFMTGFINANELKNLEAARKAYQSFLEKFPNHELMASAKTELENLGKTPEEILLAKTVKK